jgi:cobalt-precorrin-5B (C1)-methyltransferase
MARGRRKPLRSGFTTGATAAAAAKAALLFMFRGKTPRKVAVELPTGGILDITVHDCRRLGPARSECSVIKDAGDDPDITNGAEIGARVTWEDTGTAGDVVIRGGPGVGRVTKPGLEVPPGEPAINPGPQRMIRHSALQALADCGRRGKADIEIFVPQGEELARNTLNARLGILGGISILGTTGVVRPLSHEAYVATIRSALSVAKASGLDQVVLTTGRRSERFAQVKWPHIPEEGFIQIGDYFAASMEMVGAMAGEMAAAQGLRKVILAVFFGKAVKMAQGIAHTHARSARMTLEKLSRWALDISGDTALADRVARANTARHAFDLIKDDCPALIDKVGGEVAKVAGAFGGGRVEVGVVVFDFDGQVRFEWE